MDYYKLTSDEKLDYHRRQHEQLRTKRTANEPAWNAFAAANDLRQLKCDYFGGMDSYFISPYTNIIYKRDNTTYDYFIDNDPIIRALNNLH